MRWAIENLTTPLTEGFDEASAIGSTVKTVPLLKAVQSILDSSEPGSDVTEAALVFLPSVIKIASPSTGPMNPTVALAAIAALAALARNLSAGDVTSRVMPLLEALCKDEEKEIAARANAAVDMM
jgi:hypothetical protein